MRLEGLALRGVYEPRGTRCLRVRQHPLRGDKARDRLYVVVFDECDQLAGERLPDLVTSVLEVLEGLRCERACFSLVDSAGERPRGGGCDPQGQFAE